MTGEVEMAPFKDAEKWGERMIEVKIKFFTNDIAPEGKGKRIKPKTCWDSGFIVMERNGLHEITPSNPVPFNSLQKMMGKLEDVLIAHGIEMRHGNMSKKLFKEQVRILVVKSK
jgi:hypothetical protein